MLKARFLFPSMAPVVHESWQRESVLNHTCPKNVGVHLAAQPPERLAEIRRLRIT